MVKKSNSISLATDNEQSSCHFEYIEPYNLLFLFSLDRCFEDSSDAKLQSCEGVTVFFIPEKEDTDSIVATGSTGAGSYIIRGNFVARDMGFGGAVSGEYQEL